jgi:methionine-rich copper-binding protein CopC
MAASPLLASSVSLVDVQSNSTVDVAQQVGDLSAVPSVQVLGTIGNSSAGAAEVDWYEFTLDQPAEVVLLASARAGSPSFHPVLSLYNNDPLDFQDPYDLTGHRQLAQSDSSQHQGLASIDLPLSAGTYDVAVSGAGNLYFNPLLAASGYPGQTGNYHLTLAATNLPIEPGAGPSVLTVSPAAGSVLSSSPLVIRLDLSGPLDTSTINPGQNLELLYSPGGSISPGYQDVPLAGVNFSTAVNELQLYPMRALLPGTYEVILVGPSSDGSSGLADPTGVPFGADAANPAGQSFSSTFQVSGIDGNVGLAAAADDTPATAHNLGDIASQGLIQVSGAIGVDPFYDPSNPDPLYNPGNQVDLYHFRINGPGRYALAAEVFAGRIGSLLDPGVSLYVLAPDGHTLDFVAGNNNTYDPIQATDGSYPLYTDSALTAGLTAGDYYIAVSTGSNTPSPAENQPLYTPGLFDPTVSHSGSIGFGTGPYVLNLLVQPVLNPPREIASTPAPGAVLTQPPTQLTVQFSELVNLNQLAFAAYNQDTGQGPLQAVFIEDKNGTRYYPRLESYDPATNMASFLMLDRLPSGSYSLHLSGPGGLTDLAGNPLVGNAPDGDQVINFQVQAAASGVTGDLTSGYEVTLPSRPAGSIDLGVVFPHEWQAGMTMTRNPGQGQPATTVGGGDEYQFQVLQSQTYSFLLTGSNVPAGIQLSLTDAYGDAISGTSTQDGHFLFAQLAPGNYRIDVSGWDSSVKSAVAYQLELRSQLSSDNPPALTSGPTPALVIHFGDTNPPSTTPSPGGLGGEPAGPLPLLGTNGPVSPNPGGFELFHGETLSTSSAGGSGLAIPPAEISGVNSSHIDLAALGMGPLGGVSSTLQEEVQATPAQLAISTPATPVQGLLSPFVSTHAGTLGTPSPADLNSGNEVVAQPVANLQSPGSIEPTESAAPALAMPRAAGRLDPSTLAGNKQSSPTGSEEDESVADLLPGEITPLTVRIDDASTRSGMVSESRAVPDWMGWMAVAGVLSLASSRLARWQRTRSAVPGGPLSWRGANQTGWPWRRATLARPHFDLGRLHQSSRHDVQDSAVHTARRV